MLKGSGSCPHAGKWKAFSEPTTPTCTPLLMPVIAPFSWSITVGRKLAPERSWASVSHIDAPLFNDIELSLPGSEELLVCRQTETLGARFSAYQSSIRKFRSSWNNEDCLRLSYINHLYGIWYMASGLGKLHQSYLAAVVVVFNLLQASPCRHQKFSRCCVVKADPQTHTPQPRKRGP